MPLLIISIVPLLVSAVTQVSSGWVAFVSVFNAFLACVDMLQAGLVLFQIPAIGIIRQKSWRTYWRDHDTMAVYYTTSGVPRDVYAREGEASAEPARACDSTGASPSQIVSDRATKV
jgi:hypothetical protein